MPEMFTLRNLCFVDFCDTCEHAPIAELADTEDPGEEGKYQPCDACAQLDGVGMWRQAADKVPHPFQINKFKEACRCA